MQAGRKNHKITVQHLVTGSPQRTPSGELNQEWTNLYTDIWGGWTNLRGNQLFAAQQHHANVRGVWNIDWRAITADMRIVHDGLYYQILYVPPYDRHGKRVDMELECSEGLVEWQSS